MKMLLQGTATEKVYSRERGREQAEASRRVHERREEERRPEEEREQGEKDQEMSQGPRECPAEMAGFSREEKLGKGGERKGRIRKERECPDPGLERLRVGGGAGWEVPGGATVTKQALSQVSLGPKKCSKVKVLKEATMEMTNWLVCSQVTTVEEIDYCVKRWTHLETKVKFEKKRLLFQHFDLGKEGIFLFLLDELVVFGAHFKRHMACLSACICCLLRMKVDYGCG